MKNVIFGLTLLLSFSAFAESKLEDSARLNDCGGKVELRSSEDGEGVTRFALQFVGVKKCSNVRLSTGKNYKLTDSDGKFEGSKNFTLSNDAANEARSAQGLGVTVESNSGAHSEEVSVRIMEPVQVPVETTPEYESSEW